MPDLTHVPMDDTTRRLVEMARVLLDHEPETPDLDRHTGHHLEEVARTHDNWQRHLGALRLLIGSRLTRNALEAPTDLGGTRTPAGT